MSTQQSADEFTGPSFAPARVDAARRARHTLPTPVTSFVGRVREIAALKDRLRQTRLLTITGMGGIGKSRLALEVARSVDGRLTDAVALADLATVSASEHVAGAIAIALGVQDAGQRDLMDALVVSLSGRRVLLLLDNCEQVRFEVATLAVWLLQRCPDLRVLATSRAPLHAGGEAIWRLGPLGAPPLKGAQARTVLARNPSVRLFVDRARRVRPDFSLTDENAQDVGQICTRLDGIPLAIELAAVRVSLLGPRQIEERLDERFTILDVPHHDVPHRQATLLTVLDWSYELLPPDGRSLLQRLSVFAGGFSCEAAESAWGQWVAPSLPDTVITPARISALDLLAELIDLSLVIAEARNGAVRYRLLETVRQDAERLLREAGHLEATRRWGLGWLVQEAEANEARIWGGQQVAALDWCEREIDSIRVVIEWSEDASGGDLNQSQAEIYMVGSRMYVVFTLALV